jgi:hypothetical protein
MGDLFGGSTTTKSSETTETGPSKFQLPYLQGAFNAAQGAFNSSSGTPFYKGDLYAGMTEEAKASLDALKGYASGTGLATAGQLSSIGQNLAGYAGKAGSTLDQYLAEASADPTQATIDAAGKYAANPQLDAMIDANSRDVVRNLNEQTLPTLNRAASGTGNINSSRAGVAEGIARRGAEDRVADISATLRGDAYNRGLSLAQNDRNTRLGALGTAASAYSGLAGQGIGALQAGAATGYGAYDQILGANEAEQADNQGKLDQDYAKWQGEDQRQWDLLNRYFGIVGANQWGQSGTSTGTSTQKTSQGLVGGLAGLAITGAGIAGGFGFKPFK